MNETDLQRFIDLYASVGIKLTPKRTNDPQMDEIELNLEPGKLPHLAGNAYTTLCFDLDGKFTRQDIIY